MYQVSYDLVKIRRKVACKYRLGSTLVGRKQVSLEEEGKQYQPHQDADMEIFIKPPGKLCIIIDAWSEKPPAYVVEKYFYPAHH